MRRQRITGSNASDVPRHRPGQYQNPTTLMLLQALAKRDPDQAITDFTKLLENFTPVGEIADGPQIAGQPSRRTLVPPTGSHGESALGIKSVT